MLSKKIATDCQLWNSGFRNHHLNKKHLLTPYEDVNDIQGNIQEPYTLPPSEVDKLNFKTQYLFREPQA